MSPHRARKQTACPSCRASSVVSRLALQYPCWCTIATCVSKTTRPWRPFLDLATRTTHIRLVEQAWWRGVVVGLCEEASCVLVLPCPLRDCDSSCGVHCGSFHASSGLWPQAKYGVKASSGGGRSSARETVARVAAGAVAEKWLRERHGVTIVCFVSSVGPVSLPQGAAMGPGDGSVWTRSQVDARGSLTLLRPTPTRDGDAGEDEDENARRGRQEAVFVASFEAGDADVPAYVSYEGAWRTATGAVIKEREGWTKTQETVCVRCPCPQTACHMASTIRSVKAASDSIGV